jgi:hypothetical protein
VTNPLTADLNANNFNITNVKDITFNSEIANTGGGGTVNIDWTTGVKQRITMSANTTLTFTAPPGVANLLLRVAQSGGGGFTITWPTIKWSGGSPPTLTAAATGIDVISLYYNGSTYFGTFSLNFA